MLNQIIERVLMLLKFIANKSKTQEICERAVEVKGWTLQVVSYQYRIQEMCNKAIEEDL